MNWRERRLTPRMGIALEGLRIDAGLPAAELQRIRERAHEYGVVLLPCQDLTDDALYAFAESIGVILPTPDVAGTSQARVLHISNLDASGNLLPAGDNWVERNRANELWHADMSFMRPRASFSMLYARIVTEDGGRTEYCDMRLAWESLSHEEQARLEPLTARHTIWTPRLRFGAKFTEEELERYPPVERPLVEMHGPSGRKALMVGSAIATVGDLDEAATAPFLAELTERASARENVYSHRWTPGDLLIWDNHCVLHRATPYDSANQPRDLRAVRLFEPANS
jgi:alpha-ketoglutarate-dependent 2,4-dichlorophenoxyacetate dioxygenase